MFMIPHKNRLHVESPFKKTKTVQYDALFGGRPDCLPVHCPPHEQLKTKHQNKRLRYDNSQYRDVCHRNQTDKKIQFFCCYHRRHSPRTVSKGGATRITSKIGKRQVKQNLSLKRGPVVFVCVVS